MGAGLIKTKKTFLLLALAFIMGVLITVAEPDLSVLASQVKNNINSTLLIVTVGIGVGVFLLISIVKILTKASLSFIIIFFYFVVFAVCSLLLVVGNGEFLPIALDSGGVTTGPITVPFIMALGVGIASTVGGRNAKENSFGLIALCSIGPILAVLILGLVMNGNVSFVDPDYQITNSLFSSFLDSVLENMKGVGIALLLIVLFFAILQVLLLKLPKKKLYSISLGTVYTFFGLVLFLSSASIGFMPIGYKMGSSFATENKTLLPNEKIIDGDLYLYSIPSAIPKK